MRLLHVLAQYPDSTGSGVYCRQLIRALGRSGQDAQALICARNPEQEAPVFPETPLALTTLLFDSEALPFPLCGMSDVMPYRSTVYAAMSPQQLSQWKAAFRGALTRVIREFQPDLILCHHLFLLARLCLESGLPVLAICHGTDLRQAGQHPDFFQQEVGNLRGLAGALALTRQQIPDIVRLCGLPESRIFLGGGAYDDHLFYPASPRPHRAPNEPLRLLYAGKISEAKGCFELLEAFHRLPPSLPLTLDLVGRAAPEESARCNAILQGDPRVRFFPPESQDVLSEHMRRSDAFLFPSYYEGIGLIALEALASGLPLLCSDLPGLREFLGPEIWQHPRLRVVPLPPLQNLDQIETSSREAHIRRLLAALTELTQDLLDGRPLPELGSRLSAFKWSSLAGKIRAQAEDLLKQNAFGQKKGTSTMDLYALHRDRVLDAMKKAELSQLIVCDPLSIDYLSGVSVQPYERLFALILRTDRPPCLILNKLFTVPEHGLEEAWYSDTDQPGRVLAEHLLPEGKLGVDKDFPARFLLPLLEERPGLRAVLGSQLVDGVRAVKDADEIAKMREASRINDVVNEKAAAFVRPGMKETEVRDFIEREFVREGADGPSFDTIVCFGANAADPHHEPDETILHEGEVVLLDMGCIKDGYCSDMTRSFFCGWADEHDREVYETVRRANEKAESLIRPGICLAELDKAARDTIAEAGYGAFFTHRLGHFIGRAEHEAGDVSSVSEIIAEPGMIFSIEPGIYLPGDVGVRIEDLVLVTEDGCERLNQVSKALRLIGFEESGESPINK